MKLMTHGATIALKPKLGDTNPLHFVKFVTIASQVVSYLFCVHRFDLFMFVHRPCSVNQNKMARTNPHIIIPAFPMHVCTGKGGGGKMWDSGSKRGGKAATCLLTKYQNSFSKIRPFKGEILQVEINRNSP